MIRPLLLVLAMSASLASASPTGRPIYCVNAEAQENYELVDRFVRGLTGFGLGGDVFGPYETYALVHCDAGYFVRVDVTEESEDIWNARRVIVEMIANDQSETFEDVVDRLDRWGYEATLQQVQVDPCLCTGEY